MQESVSDDTNGVSRIEDSIESFARQRLYLPKFITLGMFNIVHLER
jgi:hypothetical protein